MTFTKQEASETMSGYNAVADGACPSYGTLGSPGTTARESAPLPTDDDTPHPLGALGALEAPKARGPYEARRARDVSDGRALIALEEALTAFVLGHRQAEARAARWPVPTRLSVTELNDLHCIARVFFKHAINPACAGCGRTIARPADAALVRLRGAPNQVRYFGLLCADGASVIDGACAIALIAERQASGHGGISTYYGTPIRARFPELLDVTATREGALVLPTATHAATVTERVA